MQCLALLAVLSIASAAQAHPLGYGRSILRVADSHVEYRLECSSHDLALALGIDTDLETPVPVNVFRERREDLRRYISAGVRVLSDDAVCPLRDMVVGAKAQSDWIVVSLTYRCTGPVGRLRLGYRLFFEQDPDHQNVVVVHASSGQQRALIDGGYADLEFELGPPRHNDHR